VSIFIGFIVAHQSVLRKTELDFFVHMSVISTLASGQHISRVLPDSTCDIRRSRLTELRCCYIKPVILTGHLSTREGCQRRFSPNF